MYPSGTAVTMSGAEAGLRQVSMTKMTSGASMSMRSQSSVACLLSERVLRSGQASWGCGDCVACGLRTEGGEGVCELRHVKWQWVYVKGPTVECGVAWQQCTWLRLGSRAQSSCGGA